MSRIIIIEDDNLLNNTLQFNLKMEGYEVFSCYSVSDAEKHITSSCADLLIMDVNLGDGNGFELQKKYKDCWNIPCIFLTANDMESDMLKGYELGADDYVTKPFHISVFRKKVSALLARIQKQTGGDTYDDGNLSVHFSEMTAAFSGEPINFTSMEYRLLKVLIQNPQTVLTRQILLEKLWDCERNFVDEHALTVAISRIRSKIERNGSQYIKTVYGMGYMWIGGRMK